MENIPFKMKKEFILYIGGISLFAFGFIDYAPVIMHVSRTYAAGASSFITMDPPPLLYAGALPPTDSTAPEVLHYFISLQEITPLFGISQSDIVSIDQASFCVNR